MSKYILAELHNILLPHLKSSAGDFFIRGHTTTATGALTNVVANTFDKVEAVFKKHFDVDGMNDIIATQADETNKWKVWGEEKEAALNLALEGNDLFKKETDEMKKHIAYLEQQLKAKELECMSLMANHKQPAIPSEITLKLDPSTKQVLLLAGLCSSSMVKTTDIDTIIRKANELGKV